MRLIVENLFSFKELTEFNMFPGRFSRKGHHIYLDNERELLKLNVIYGANGAGKSNLIHALFLLKEFVTTGTMPIEFITETFKFDKDSAGKNVYLGIEFSHEGVPYYYGLTINRGIVIEEELEVSGLGKKENKRLFLRTDQADTQHMQVSFSDELLADKESALFPEFLQNEILERNKPVLFYMKNRKHDVFFRYKNALEWFEKGIELISPDSRPQGLALRMEVDKAFFDFSVAALRSFGTGIVDIRIKTMPIEDFFGEHKKQDAERIIAELRAKPGSRRFISNAYEEVVFVLEDGMAVAKRLCFAHGEDQGEVTFHAEEESDGTRRLIEYLPALYTVINRPKVYFIDEIERSVHALLIKGLISKFSADPGTKGQLVFSTHESNLMDLDIFRQDEIWFAEKNNAGATELYPLSEFKVHHTTDIQKNYLNGRFGAIPFLGNLEELNWDKYAEAS